VQHETVSSFELADIFSRDGYVVIRRALSESEVRVLTEITDEIIKHPLGTDFPDKYLCVATRHQALLALIECPTTFPHVVAFLRHYNIHLYTSQLIVAPPARKRSVGWHTDGGQPQPIAKDGISALTSLKVGYFLTSTLEDNSGSLEVVPGSQYKRLGWKLESKKQLDTLYSGDIDGAVQLRMNPGDAVIFDQRLWHASRSNESSTARRTIYYGYAYGQLRPLDYETIPMSVLEGCTPIAKQMLGHRLSSFRAYSFYSPEEEDVPLKKWYEGKFGQTWI
jgi:ectoine hydroxylase